ncbi:hypothetical protein A3B42_03900 [Candidatus Daviesbacteria bacterium RIFCSPLOWO2_01_FULL_38_10]|uniref:LytR/CpsA/Psr regulator C-terminal domain-containing protein n=1 Tax=Candidatus Daviesbacteria bacterium GW2011_GWF2_38_6 TaxID=1618432 RepID=A0A0G0KBI5_9BACT|nr:MAG: hypothetical protein US99_C0051G0003 [Candidatus Daviesbacteria bacterium GW2011_GWF2_38_6]OGE27403.1 MAG: hypothetical protein A3D02_03960 [Candidatus Daviesbacteria bacterium RIFCSPHIGHO2_02_FULL_39_41]OGE27481.1 MAG: hypothetical protein A2772_02085 [Candidatus Daviesbacteria bacterium RIFCSPHIGHO2_01_FULL_38_8b]OGE38408.1 MAG: hypothetical protein A3B42_03900 [Candidatus Daviesbacteria bacterium RIFCSPLOWO2_01_FULL_38_10]OGE45524.1 MAG: hypothetical protein A3E67_00085 [Candidatus D
MPKWKLVQSSRKQKKKIKLALLTVVFLGLLFLAGGLSNLTKTLTSPWQLAVEKKNFRWDGSYNINVVFKGVSVSLVGFNPVSKKITIIKIPNQTYLDVQGGFGKWQIRSVYDLGQSGAGGAEMLERTITSFFGVPVQGFIQLKGDFAEKEAEDFIYWIRQNPANIFLALNNTKSDLSPLELINLNLSLFQVRFDKVNSINPETLALDKSSLPDQTEVLIGDPVRIDSISQALVDDNVLKEHKTVAVFNATDRPLIAQKAARIITNLGGNVIQISNTSLRQDKTRIWGEQSQTLKRLTQIFSCCDKIEPQLEGISSRAQINVILGEDFFFRLGN